VGKMLQENLLDKFRSTEQFRQIYDMLFSADILTVDPQGA